MSHYWRHPAVPHIEIRNVEDGRRFSHELHAHSTFSIGAIIAGESTYISGHTSRRIAAGSVVMMNPGVVHACNPVHDQPWAYRMFYIEAGWLASIQHQTHAATANGFIPFADNYRVDPELFATLDGLYSALMSETDDAVMQSKVCAFFEWLVARLQPQRDDGAPIPPKLSKAAAYIRERCEQALPLGDIARAVQLSESYLIRAFKAHYGLTPHGYLVDCRLQCAREGLRLGRPIAEVAAQAGFADQAHLQRLFKRTLAATPGQYRG